MGELLQVFIETPFTVILALLGVAFIGIALIGEVPFIRFTGPISSRRSFAIGVFGMTLLASSFGMTFILAASTAPQPDFTPTEVAVSNTTTPGPDATLVVEEPTRTPQSTPTLPTATERALPTDEAVSPTNETAPAALSDPTIPSRTTVNASTACNTMEEMRPHHNPQYGVPWVLEPYSEDRIIEVWSNHHLNNLDVHLYFLPAGERAECLSGGGVEYRDRPGCDFAAGEYERKKNNPHPSINDEQYQQYIADGSIP
jgi:hypothetical protein